MEGVCGGAGGGSAREREIALCVVECAGSCASVLTLATLMGVLRECGHTLATLQ